jgi:hypothetical protein
VLDPPTEINAASSISARGCLRLSSMFLLVHRWSQSKVKTDPRLHYQRKPARRGSSNGLSQVRSKCGLLSGTSARTGRYHLNRWLQPPYSITGMISTLAVWSIVSVLHYPPARMAKLKTASALHALSAWAVFFSSLSFPVWQSHCLCWVRMLASSSMSAKAAALGSNRSSAIAACSYGSVPCPPIQAGRTCGDDATSCCFK